MEDMDLYVAKQFFYGKAKDNNAAAVYDLALATPGTEPTEPTTTPKA